MRNHFLRLLIPACAAFTVGAVHADTAPPIKPGLWQIQSAREMDGKALPDFSERFKDMPAAVRERMAAMMKQRGVDMGGGSDLKICLSKESLDSGHWQNSQGNCKTTYGSRSNKRWKWHSVCTQPAAESDGEAQFIDAENYTVDTTMKMNREGSDHTMHITLHSKWLGADCGDIKPVAAMTQPAQ